MLVSFVCALLLVQTWSKAHRVDGNDLTSYLLSARALWEGRSPYSPDTPFPYVYPMLLAFALIPWLALPYGAAVIAWFAASVAALGAMLSTTTCGRAVAMGATAAITFGAIQNTLLNGQVNFFVVLCCVLAVVAARSGREISAGMWLGAGVAFKLMPALLGLYFLVRGRGKAIAVTAAAALVLALVPGILLGDRAWDAYADYARQFLIPVLKDPPAARQDAMVFSLGGVVHGWLGEGAPRWVGPACALAVVAATAAVDLLRWRPRSQDLAAGAAYMLAIVLVSPKSEIHHLAFVIPAVAVCCTWWLSGESRTAAWPAAAMIAASLGLMGARLAGPLQGTVICAALLLLGIALAGLSPSSASPQGNPRSSSSSPSCRAGVP